MCKHVVIGSQHVADVSRDVAKMSRTCRRLPCAVHVYTYPTQFSGLLNPTLVFADSSGAKDVAEGARGLAGAMQRAVLVEGKGRYMYSEQLSTEMLNLFAAHGFRGHLNDLGHNAKAPLLTKLRGGLRSWQGEL